MAVNRIKRQANAERNIEKDRKNYRKSTERIQNDDGRVDTFG